MKRVKTSSRFILAGILIFAVGDIILGFPNRPEPPIEAQNFLISLTAAGFIWPTVGFVFLTSAILLCIRRTIGLGLVMLAPIMVCVTLYHLLLDPSFATAGRDLILVVVHAATCFWHRENFSSLVTRSKS